MGRAGARTRGGQEGEAAALASEALSKAEDYRRRKRVSVLAILFTDIEQSTNLREELGEAAFEEIREEHDATLRDVICRDDAGAVVQFMGDGVLAVFSEPSAAVERALGIQRALHGHRCLRVRAGIDMGQVSQEIQGGIVAGVFGRHVNRASRIQTAALPTHVLTSFQVYDCAVGWLRSPEVAWANHGRVALKGFAAPVELYEAYDPELSKPQPALAFASQPTIQGGWPRRLLTWLRIRAAEPELLEPIAPSLGPVPIETLPVLVQAMCGLEYRNRPRIAAEEVVQRARGDDRGEWFADLGEADREVLDDRNESVDELDEAYRGIDMYETKTKEGALRGGAVRSPGLRAAPPELRESYSTTTARAAVSGRDLDVELERIRGITTRGVPLRILWVDDHPENNAPIQALLEGAGSTIHLVTSTDAALARMEAAEPYEMVITDMGRGDDPVAGLELLAEMKRRPSVLPPPALLFSSPTAVSSYGPYAQALGAAVCTSGAISLLRAIADRIPKG